MRPWLLSCLVLVLALPLPSQGPAVLTPRPVVRFGGATDDPDDEMLRVGSVRQIAPDRFIVVNGKPLALRVYTAEGRVLRTLGRAGAGPGESQYGLTVVSADRDSVLAYSMGTRRWLLFRTDGGLIREWPLPEGSPSPSVSPVLRGSAVVTPGIPGSIGCPAAALDRLAPRSRDDLLESLVDGSGRLWLREYGEPIWSIHAPDGGRLARARLPDPFRVAEFRGDTIVGVHEDEDGFSHVMVLPLSLPPVRPATRVGCAELPLPVTRVRAAEIKTGMRNAMTVAEAFYAERRRYPATADEYPAAITPPGTTLVVRAGDATHFAIAIIDRETGWRCLVSVGDPNPALDGRLLCGG